MNRAERRRQNKSANKPSAVRMMTDAQIEQLKWDATYDAIRLILTIPNIVLSDHFQFDPNMLDEFNHYTMSWVDGVQKGETTMRELMEICEKEAGIRLSQEKRRNT